MREAIVEMDLAVDRALARVRGPALDGVVYRLSSAADHSLLWDVCGTLTAIARGDDVGFAMRFGAAMAAESLLTNGVVKTAFRRVRPALYEDIVFSHGLHRPITSSFPSGHATAAASVYQPGPPPRRRAAQNAAVACPEGKELVIGRCRPWLKTMSS
jgi:hypothetical protein